MNQKGVENTHEENQQLTKWEEKGRKEKNSFKHCQLQTQKPPRQVHNSKHIKLE